MKTLTLTGARQFFYLFDLGYTIDYSTGGSITKQPGTDRIYRSPTWDGFRWNESVGYPGFGVNSDPAPYETIGTCEVEDNFDETEFNSLTMVIPSTQEQINSLNKQAQALLQKADQLQQKENVKSV